MWPSASPPAAVTDLDEVPSEARAYYEQAEGGGFVLRDILDHVTSVHTPDCLKPAYQIRQYSHRRASFLKRELVPAEWQGRLPRYPRTLAAYRAGPRSDALHADLLYAPSGVLWDEFREGWSEV
jgi:hypothetical protein